MIFLAIYHQRMEVVQRLNHRTLFQSIEKVSLHPLHDRIRLRNRLKVHIHRQPTSSQQRNQLDDQEHLILNWKLSLHHRLSIEEIQLQARLSFDPIHLLVNQKVRYRWRIFPLSNQPNLFQHFSKIDPIHLLANLKHHHHHRLNSLHLQNQPILFQILQKIDLIC